MTPKPKTDSVIEGIHRVRREISDRFKGDIAAIAADADARAAASGRPIWKPTEKSGVEASGEGAQRQ